jgi:CheY-like chemotaxis protein
MAEKSDKLRDARILVVEDDRDTREIVQFILERSGAAVVAVGSVTKALETYMEIEPDVVIADIAMPDYNGYALIAQIREEDERVGRTTPAIALTAFTSAADHERALSAGFQEYMAKPFDPGELIATVSKLLHTSGPSDNGNSAA